MMAGLIGIAIAFGLTFGAVIVGGGVTAFIHIPSLIIALGVPIGLALVTYRPKELLRALLSLQTMVSRQPSDLLNRQNAHILRQMIAYTYAAGIVATMIGWIQMLNFATDEGVRVISLGFSRSILSMFYALVISEFLLRPGARRIESACERAPAGQDV